MQKFRHPYQEINLINFIYYSMGYPEFAEAFEYIECEY